MKTAIITLSGEGASIVRLLKKEFAGADVYIHESVPGTCEGKRFRRIAALAGRVFRQYRNLVFIAPCGIVVRAVAPHLAGKRQDPAVVVVDAGARYAVSLLSGHEGGANDLAFRVANILGAEPVISTTTEAVKTVIAGVGCRRGTAGGKIVAAVREALERAGLDAAELRMIASADLKKDEPGLMEAAAHFGVPIRLVPSAEIRSSGRSFAVSDFVVKKTGLPAVAEPAALLAGRRTRLILPKLKVNGVTVALARESFTWSE